MSHLKTKVIIDRIMKEGVNKPQEVVKEELRSQLQEYYNPKGLVLGTIVVCDIGDPKLSGGKQWYDIKVHTHMN